MAGKEEGGKSSVAGKVTEASHRPSEVQRKYLARGLDQAGGKLPLFDGDGQAFAAKTIRACITHGWAEPWFANPTKPDWLVCKLTAAGYTVLGADVPSHLADG